MFNKFCMSKKKLDAFLKSSDLKTQNWKLEYPLDDAT